MLQTTNPLQKFKFSLAYTLKTNASNEPSNTKKNLDFHWRDPYFSMFRIYYLYRLLPRISYKKSDFHWSVPLNK
jgi:hypothetical protein